jgi:hypothetical protein
VRTLFDLFAVNDANRLTLATGRAKSTASLERKRMPYCRIRAMRETKKAPGVKSFKSIFEETSSLRGKNAFFSFLL